MEDLRRSWKVPYIVYFCNLFEQKLDLIDLRVDEFEEALLDDCGLERNIIIIHLLQKLLKPFINRSIDLTNYDQYLLQVLRKNNIDNLYFTKTNCSVDADEKLNDKWSNLSMLTKLDIIYQLCELRLQLNDIEAKLSDYEANELRLEPLGIDSNGNKLWYFGDLRLYEQKPEKKLIKKKITKPVKKKSKPKQTKSVQNMKKTRQSARLRSSIKTRRSLNRKEEELESERESEIESESGQESQNESEYEIEEVDVEKEEQDEKDVDDEDEKEKAYKNELNYWSCLCTTLEDWINLSERLKSSKKKQDQELSDLLETQYLTEMPALFQKAEKEKAQRLAALQPKRQSERLLKQHKTPMNESDTHTDSNEDEAFLKLPVSEQERIKREKIARQREERLKQRLLKRESLMNDFNALEDTSSQDNSNNYDQDNKDFNIRNFFLMHKVLTKLLQCKYAWPFKNAVSEDDAPDYNSIIETPMDLSTIQLKINNKVYKSRKEFVNDLELITQNCINYNGDDTFYGKLAVKFENYFKRWLQIFYPREISTSLEEKNRQLMKLIQRNENSNDANFDADSNTNQAPSQTDDQISNNENSLPNSIQQQTHNQDSNQEFNSHPNNILFDFSNNNDIFSNTQRKKRKHDPNKDKYLQEPQFVTKRTSSGRLVKMKISTDYDYTSDQEKEKNGSGPGRRKKRDDDDDGTMEGIQQKHRKDDTNPMLNGFSSSSDQNSSNDSSSNSSSSSSNSDDDEFTNKYKPKKLNKLKKTRKYVRKRDEFGNLIPRKKRTTIKQLTESIQPNKLNKIFENSEDESNQSLMSSEDIKSNLNIKINPIQQSITPGKYTFEQYVKKLNSNCTVGQALAVADAVKKASLNLQDTTTTTINTTITTTTTTTSPAINTTTPVAPRISLKINPATSSTNTPTTTTPKLPLTVPIVNPAIKAALNRINQNQIQTIVNSTENSSGLSLNKNPIKIIAVNSSSQSNGSPVSINGNKKFLIINNSANLNSSTSSPNNVVKIINIKTNSSNGGTITKPIIMINKPVINLSNQQVYKQSETSVAQEPKPDKVNETLEKKEEIKTEIEASS